MIRRTILVLALLSLTTGAAVGQKAAQSQTNVDDVRGFVSFADFGSSFSSSGHVIKLDTSAGYNLSNHLGFDFGVPFYFAGGTATTTAGSKVSASATGMGAPYFAIRAMYQDEEGFGYAGRFAVYLPAGDVAAGLSAGTTAFDWNNHFEQRTGRFTPYGEIGIANTVSDSRKYNRPYLSYGDNLHVEGGAGIDVSDKFGVGGSAFDIFPWGQQTVYSRVLPQNSGALASNGNSSHPRPFEQNYYSIGSSGLAKDKGVSAWVDYMPAPYVTAEVGYTRSIQYALNTMSVNMRFDIGYLTRNRARK